MNRTSRPPFSAQSGVALLSGFLAVLTLFWREWIEALLGVDPDAGSGSAEWLVVGLMASVALTSALLARVAWRRLRDGRLSHWWLLRSTDSCEIRNFAR